MKLYGSLTSPFVRKVRMVLREKGIAHEFIVEGASDAAGNVARLNPLHAVPVLERDDGEVLFDSPFICEYLDSLTPSPRLYPPAGEPRWQALRWHALGHGMMEACVTRLLESRRADACRDRAVLALHEGRIAAAIDYAAARVPADGFLVGGQLSIADIALIVALEYVDLRYPHDWRTRCPQLAGWLAAHATRASVAETRPPKS
jgi:glutathione S-transferase